MPVLLEQQALPEARGSLGQGLAEKAEPAFGDVLGAAFRQENLVASAVDALSNRTKFQFDPDYSPWDDIRGTKYGQNYADRFTGVASSDESRHIMARIDREEADRETIAAGGAAGVVSSVAAGVLDPTILMPSSLAAKAARGISVARAAAGTAVAGGVATGVQEVGLQATQEVRGADEGAVNIAAGTLLGGLLGGAAAGLGKARYAQIEKQFSDVVEGLRSDPDFVPWQPASAGAASSAEARGSGEMKGALGSEKIGSLPFLGSPVTRLQTSEFETARNTVRDLADAGAALKENAEGVATSIGGTVENRITMRQGGLGQAIAETDSLFARYWFGDGAPSLGKRMTAPIRSETARWTGQSGGRLTAQEFRVEVGKAMARNDEHPVPEIAEAARAYRKFVFDPLKNEAIANRLLPEDVKAIGADSYIARVYNRDQIIAQRNVWIERLTSHFKGERNALVSRADEAGERADSYGAIVDLTDAEILSLADEVTEAILGNASLRLPGLDLVQGPRGPLRARVLNVPDELIEEFLERDVEKVARIYTRTMAADIELTAKFGSLDLAEQINKLTDEKNAKAAAAKNDKERTRIERAYQDARADLEALRDRARNVYALPDNPDGIAWRAGKIAQNLNYLRLLGGMTISAIPDLARPIMVHGAARVFADGWKPLVTNLATFKLAAREIKLAGTALDMVLDTRALSMADLFDDWQRGSKFERGIEALGSRFGLVTLMAPWNATMKQLAGVVSMSEIIRASRVLRDGKATPKQIESLAASGIDANLARRIADQFDQGGVTKDGVFLPNTEDWTDNGAREAFRTAIVREVERVIVTPGLEKPLWISTPIGKILGQFKSFAFAANQKILIAGLQQRDAAFVSGTVASMALGALSYWARQQVRGEDGQKSLEKAGPVKWAVEAMDASGLATIFSEVNNIAEKVTRGRVGLSALTGETASRYQSRNAIGALLGPSFELGTEAISVTGSAFAGEWSAADTRSVRKIVPFQNLFYLRTLLDDVEQGFNAQMGIPARQ